MTTSERIAAAIKPILDEDRRADRERIAELERDLAVLRARLLGGSDEEELSKVSYNAYIDVFSGEIDRLTEKCAALVVERNKANESFAKMRKFLSDVPTPEEDEFGQKWPMLVDHMAVYFGVLISDAIGPEPQAKTASVGPTGFLVETPAVEEQGPWVIRTAAFRYESRDNYRLSNSPDGARIFHSKKEAQEHIDAECQGWASFHYPLNVITLAEARAIEAKR